MHPSLSYARLSCSNLGGHALVLHEAGQAEPAKPRLLDRVRAAARLRHYSRRTEAAYVAWIRRYVLFHGERGSIRMPDVNGYGSGCSPRRGPTATARRASGGGIISTSPCSSAW